MDKKTLSKIGNSLISSTILSGAPIWSQTTDINIMAVQRAQTKAARMVSGMNGWGYSENRTHRQEVFEKLKWKNTRQLITTANLNLLKLAIDNKSAESINKLFKKTTPAHPRGITVTRVDHTGPATRKQTSFEVQSAIEFNNLPDLLRSPLLTTLGFKTLLKGHISLLHPLATHSNN